MNHRFITQKTLAAFSNSCYHILVLACLTSFCLSGLGMHGLTTWSLFTAFLSFLAIGNSDAYSRSFKASGQNDRQWQIERLTVAGRCLVFTFGFKLGTLFLFGGLVIQIVFALIVGTSGVWLFNKITNDTASDNQDDNFPEKSP